MGVHADGLGVQRCRCGEDQSIAHGESIPRGGGSWYSIPMPKPANPIPPGFHSITPHLAIIGAAKYIDFLKSAFNAVEVRRSSGPIR